MISLVSEKLHSVIDAKIINTAKTELNGILSINYKHKQGVLFLSELIFGVISKYIPFSFSPKNIIEKSKFNKHLNLLNLKLKYNATYEFINFMLKKLKK